MSSVLGVVKQQDDLFYAKEVLNRVSFLRDRPEFINVSITHPTARFIFFDQTNPLIKKESQRRLVIGTNADGVLTGEGQVSKGLKNLPSWNKVLEQFTKDNAEHHHELRKGKPTFLFLGIEDESVGADLSQVDHLTFEDRYKGIPYYAVGLDDAPELSKEIQKFFADYYETDDKGVFYTTSMKHYVTFSEFEGSLFSHGRMFLDWLGKTKFCAGCGARVIPIHAGGKLFCTNDKQTGVSPRGRKIYECPVKNTRVSNLSFPRTDAVIITAVVDVDRTKVLLSMSRRFAITNMYTCTSGFMEPSESIEIATKREIWEETGVKARSVSIVSTQPWPFPGNLMIGCVAEVEFNGTNEVIDLNHDRELEDARWFDMDFVKLLVNDQADAENNPEGIIIPFGQSIAYHLLKLVVDQAQDKSKL